MKRLLAHLFAVIIAGICPVMAADTAATVTESVNDVSHGSAQVAGTSPAAKGTHIQDGEYLKTGAQSRAELQLSNQSITRLGSNTVFNYSVANNEVDLQSGTILFSKPKDGKEMIIKTASVTAAIVGTSGFAQLHNKQLIFGLIEGHATLTTAGGTPYKIGPGEVLRLSGDGKPQLFFFDIPLFLSTSPLLTKFHSTLPNQTYINAEVAKYKEFAARGFICPPTEPLFVSDIGSSVPVIPVLARDSAANALSVANMKPAPDVPLPMPAPMPPPPPPPSGPFGFGP